MRVKKPLQIVGSGLVTSVGLSAAAAAAVFARAAHQANTPQLIMFTVNSLVASGSTREHVEHVK
jgi:hypothetical protein